MSHKKREYFSFPSRLEIQYMYIVHIYINIYVRITVYSGFGAIYIFILDYLFGVLGAEYSGRIFYTVKENWILH